jgi:UDP-GlcNAc:undecaprenyl-phosphate/decaprenyl-phosphate GlcNAc-1-phosphate transferase
VSDAAISAAALSWTVALGLSLLLTPLVRGRAVRANLVEAPGGRRVHHAAMPRLGGVAIVCGWYLAVAAGLAVLAALGGAVADAPWLAGLLLGAAVIVGAGVVDDLRGLGPVAKLLAQLIAALVAALLGVRLTAVVLPWGQLELGLLGVPVSVLWIVAVVNAMNLIDGLDGLAAGLTVIAASAFLGVALLAQSPGASTLIATTALLGASLGFLRYNVHPASIIMGDTGSMAIGFVLASLAIGLAGSGGAGINALVPIVILALPLGDTLFAIVRRAVRRRPISAPDADHVHHRLLRGGGSVRRAVLVLYAASAAFGVAGVLLAIGAPAG